MTESAVQAPASIDEIIERLTERRYIVDRGLATSIFLALRLGKPLFIEGEAGVGKTEAAKVMADVLGARLFRLQCYEGIDLAHAVYEWNYPRQLLHIRLLGEGDDRRTAEREIFSPEFLLRRPLLDAIDNDDPTPPTGSRARSRHWSRGCAEWTSTRCRGSPKRLTGRARWPRSAPRESTRPSSMPRWARPSNIRRIWSASASRSPRWSRRREVP